MTEDKFKQIDQYRKALVAERRHGFKRLIKYWLENTELYYLSFLTLIKLYLFPPAQQKINVDILLFQHSEKVIKLNRKKKLKDALKNKGYKLAEVSFCKGFDVLNRGQIIKPSSKVPFKYLYHAAYAEYLVNTYNPKILLNDRNGMLLAPFLRDALNRRNAKLVQLAHATTVEDDWQFSMNDYDYYFLFGQSSFEYLQQRSLLFGSSKVVLAGSHMIDESFKTKDVKPYNNQILLLGMGPDREKTSLAEFNYNLILEWITNNKDHKLIVKPHPRSDMFFWKKQAKTLTNIELLSGSYSLSQALQRCSIVITIESNAILEASLAAKPIIYVNNSNSRDIFFLEKYLGMRVKNIQSLDKQVKSITADYEKHVEKTKHLKGYHLSNDHGLNVTVSLIQAIYQDKEIPSIKTLL